ncbi:MAG: acyl carrier protein [Lachnospiraceae bacterium]|nr:acyl carrier protein [Lachnospiraceae bacterium]
MDKIKINNQEQFFDIKNIAPVSKHVLQVTFADTIPDEFGNIEVFTSGGDLCSSFPGYSTIYKTEGQTILLSNDGSVYTDPEEIPPYEPPAPTFEELQAAKKAEVSAACEKIIYKGIDVGLSDDTVGHFSLTIEDQLNLFGKQAQLATGADRLEYHADGQPCRYYSAEDMKFIIEMAMFHVSYHTTYCNALNMWIAGCETAEELQEIFYGADVPEEYQSEVLKAYILEIAQMAEVPGETQAVE